MLGWGWNTVNLFRIDYLFTPEKEKSLLKNRGVVTTQVQFLNSGKIPE